MNDTLISAIQQFTIQSRHNLEREASEQLEGIYGWLPDGTFASANLYPAQGQSVNECHHESCAIHPERSLRL